MSQVVTLARLTSKMRRLLTTNAADSSFAAKVATITKPGAATGYSPANGVIPMTLGEQAMVPEKLKIIPFGTGADDSTFSIRVIGWEYAGDLWIPIIRVEIQCTLGTAVGVIGTSVKDTEKFSDVLSMTTGNTSITGYSNSDLTLWSPSNNLISEAVVDVRGSELVELQFTTGSSATDCNALVGAL